MKLNKILVIFLFFSILICLNGIYASTITKEDIKENLEGTLVDTVIFEGENIMKMKYEDIELECEYDLTNNPTFSVYMNFKKDMTEEEYQNEASKLMGLICPFVAVAKEKNVDMENSAFYIMMKMFKLDSAENLSSKFSEALELMQDGTNTSNTSQDFFQDAKQYFTTSNSINENVFTITYSVITDTEDNYNVKAEMVVKEDQDFTVVTSFMKEFEEQMKDSVKIDTTTTKSTSGELPKAGIDNTLRNILITAICISILSIILTNIKYKKTVKNRDV